MGHPGEAALAKLIDEAHAAGIIVTTANVDLPESEAQYKADGFGYVGQKLYPSGQMLGNAAVDICSLRPGDKAMVWGLLGQQGRGERTKGIVNALKAKGVDVQYLEISDAVNNDPSQGVPVFSAFYASNPDLKAVITDHGTLTATIPLYSRMPMWTRTRSAGRASIFPDRPRKPSRRLCPRRPRPTAVPSRLPADHADVSDLEVRLRRVRRGHRCGHHQQGQHRRRGPSGCGRNSISWNRRALPPPQPGRRQSLLFLPGKGVMS